MRYMGSGYEMCDVNYDQSGVVISEKALVMKYVINDYDICDIGYEPKGVDYKICR